MLIRMMVLVLLLAGAWVLNFGQRPPIRHSEPLADYIHQIFLKSLKCDVG